MIFPEIVSLFLPPFNNDFVYQPYNYCRWQRCDARWISGKAGFVLVIFAVKS